MKASRHVRPLTVTGALAALAAGVLSLVAGPASGGTHSPAPMAPSREVVVVNGPGNPVQVGASTPLQVAASSPLEVAASSPLQVAASSPLAVTPPLWQGTPFLDSAVVLNSGPFELCKEVFTAAEGTAVLLTTITGDFNVPPNGVGGVRVELRLPDGTQRRVEVPMHRTAGALQVSGPYDRYVGDLVLDGFPVTRASACVRGHDSAAGVAFLGFTVPLT